VRTPRRVLVVDDNPSNVRVVRARLAGEGYDVVTAGDGEEALTVARATGPDLILLDVMMPKLDGIEVCRRLKAMRDLPFVSQRVYAAVADLVRAREVGPLQLKGFHRPVVAYEVVGLAPETAGA